MERQSSLYTRTSIPKEDIFREIVRNPLFAQRELNKRSFFEFLQYFFPVVSSNKFQPNWHIEFLCDELQQLATRVANKEPKLYDIIINVPPGSTKTILASIMFPVWCWSHLGHWMRFITASYTKDLALESAEYCRDLLRSIQFREMYPDIEIREDKDTKSNFKIAKKVSDIKGGRRHALTFGGRYSTSVGGTLMGFHGDILIVDDPLNPTQAASEIELATANRWMEETLTTRKTNKDITPTVLIMQRLHQDDPAGHILNKRKDNVKHICFPGEIANYKQNVQPPEMIRFYQDGLFDPKRMSWKVLDDLQADLGQYGYAGQIGQDPTPPGGGMFKVDRFIVATERPHAAQIVKTVRYWDKAATAGGSGAYTAGVKMSLLLNGKWVIEDVKRGRWGTEEREKIIRSVAEADGFGCQIWSEQEPGGSGKESAEATIRNLGGFSAYAERPTGDKTVRADPFSVQVNNGNVLLLKGDWHREYLDELRFFPFSTYKDQVDASSGAFSKLTQKKLAQRII